MRQFVPWHRFTLDSTDPWGPFRSGGIQFGGLSFSEPMPVGSARAPHAGGLFVLLEPAPIWRPRPYRPVSFGSAANLNEALEPWMGNDTSQFLVAVCPLLFASAAERALAQRYLSSLYGCAEEPSPAQPSLEARLRRVEEQVLPKKEEQTAEPIAKRQTTIGFIRDEART